MTNPLASDLIEEMFGETHLEIVSQSGNRRVTALRDRENRLLAYNMVFFGGGGNEFPDVHLEITRGNHIGKTFRKYGYEIDRLERCCFLYEFPAALRDEFRTEAKEGFVKYADLSVKSNGRLAPYASVIEIYATEIAFLAFETEGELRRSIEDTIDFYFWKI